MPIKLFLVRKSGGGGESKQILREYGFKKNSKITDDPLVGYAYYVVNGVGLVVLVRYVHTENA